MLVANKDNGERFSLGNGRTKKELQQIRSQEKFYCPECGEEVIMKLGNKKIWHFSHLAAGSCQYEYDRESDYHLSGKLKLYYWLKKQGVNAELEKYDSIMRQKPDIAFEWKGQKYAIEFQCSVIQPEIFEKRTNAYLQHGVTPIWIAAENLIKRKAHMLVSMNNFLFLFIRRPCHSWMIPAFCPISDQFIILHGAIPITSRKAISDLEVQSLHHFSIENLLSPIVRKFPLLTIWKKENQKLKSRYLMTPGAHRNPFLTELYRNRLILLTLPPEIGLPVHSSPFIETASFIWQTYLYLDVFRHYLKGDTIIYANIREAFDRRVKRGEIKLRILPVAGQRDYRYALAEYVFLLTKVSLLEKIDSNTVKVMKEIIIPSSIEEQLEAEAKFFSENENKITELIFP